MRRIERNVAKLKTPASMRPDEEGDLKQLGSGSATREGLRNSLREEFQQRGVSISYIDAILNDFKDPHDARLELEKITDAAPATQVKKLRQFPPKFGGGVTRSWPAKLKPTRKAEAHAEASTPAKP